MLSNTREQELVPGFVKTMSDREFHMFSTMIYSVTGIKMPPMKKLMLTSRLNKRIRELKLQSFSQYYDFVCSPAGREAEYHRMIDAVTTNKTDFFREPEHFTILNNRVFPEFAGMNRPLRIWSAGCSTGEEPYTIAMVAADYFNGDCSAVSILATDISTRVLGSAMDGVYSEDAIRPVPLHMKKKYILRGKGDKQGYFRMSRDIRRMVTFKKLNLMDKQFDIGSEMDIIFCRNVIIYFDRATQMELFDRFYRVLPRRGYLFIGSSETLHGLDDRFVHAGPTVYRKR